MYKHKPNFIIYALTDFKYFTKSDTFVLHPADVCPFNSLNVAMMIAVFVTATQTRQCYITQ